MMAAKEMWKKWFRRDNLLILILSGILLFIIALPEKSADSGKESDAVSAQEQRDVAEQDNGAAITAPGASASSDSALTAELEERLEAVLSQMAGVGKVKVMITLQSSEELVVEKDGQVTRSNTNESDSAGGSRIITQVDSDPSTVYRTSGSDSEPYVVKTLSPRVEGVVVVAQGAGKGTVDRSITEMVQALFGVEAHKVKVVKMASSN